MNVQAAADAVCRRNKMNISGILVVADAEHIDAVLAQLEALEGVEVDQCDRASGRIVVVQEAPDVGAEVAGFGRIRTLKHVWSAGLVCHYFGDELEAEPPTECPLPSPAAPTPGAPAA